MSMLKKILFIVLGFGILCGSILWYLTYFQEGYFGSLDLKNKKIIVFDFDGTLCDSLQIAINEFNTLAPKWHLTPIGDVEKIRNDPLQIVLKLHGVSNWKLPFIKHLLIKRVAKHVPCLQTFPEMHKTLIELKNRGYYLGILSSNSYENINQFLEKQGLKNFSFVYYGSNLFGKARLLKKIKLTTKASIVFYIGDENRDIEAAINADIPIVAVTWGYQSKKLLTLYSPTHIIESPLELLEILKQ